MFAAAPIALMFLGVALGQQAGQPPAPQQGKHTDAQYAGPKPDGFLLPNGWKLTPAGEHLTLSDLPLNILPLKNEARVVVTTNGFNTHGIQIVDLATNSIVVRQTSWESWFGLATDESQSGKTRLWWSGGGSDRIHELLWSDSKLTWISTSDNTPTARGKKKLRKINDLCNFPNLVN
jgi:hypothetical protein